MSYTEKAIKIREELKNFKKQSFLKEVLSYLHQPEESNLDTAKKLPYVAFLLIEWLFQVDEASWARDADDKDISKYLNKIWGLQGDAAPFRDEVHYGLVLRKLLSAQFWPQKNKLHRWFGLMRLYSLTMGKDVSSWFSDDFKKANNISMKDFYTLSLWLMIRFDENRHALNYHRVVIELTPYFDLETVCVFLEMVGINLLSLNDFLEPSKFESVKIDSYFANTQLTKKPILFLENTLTTPHAALLSKSISEFVLEDFKSRDHERFRIKFTKEFEKYAEVVLNEAGIKYINENTIKNLFGKHKKDSKVVDFIVNKDNSTVFIDAKGIEPHRKVQVSDNPKLLKEKLSSSFIHGVVQAFGCASTLAEINEISIAEKNSCYVLIVTHHDFYLLNGRKLNDQVDPNLHANLIKEYGDYFPMENIYFVAIEDFEGIVKLCKDTDTSLSDFLSYCVNQDSSAEKSKFDTRQHLEEYAKYLNLENSGPIGTDYVLNRKDEMFDHLMEVVETSVDYWRKGGTSILRDYFLKYAYLKSRMGLDIEFMKR